MKQDHTSAHWSARLIEAMEERRISAADLARETGIPATSIRKYRSGVVAQPRGDLLPSIARALGVEALWLRDGAAPKRAGDLATQSETESADLILHRRQIAQRIARARRDCGFDTPEEAALGTILDGPRWRRIESGALSPTHLDLVAVSDRLNLTVDWLLGRSYSGGPSAQAVNDPPALELHEPPTQWRRPGK